MSQPESRSPIRMLIIQMVRASATSILTSVVIVVGFNPDHLCTPVAPVPEVQTQTEESHRDSGAQ